MANFTVQYATNVLIPDPNKKSELRQLHFFRDAEGTHKEDVEWEVRHQMELEPFIKDKGGYWRKTSTIVSFIVKENKTEFKNFETIGENKL